MYCSINTKDLPRNLQMYLPIVVDLLLESTINCDGIKIHYTDIIAELEKDVISLHSGIGFMPSSHFLCGSFSSVLMIYFQVSTLKFVYGVPYYES